MGAGRATPAPTLACLPPARQRLQLPAGEQSEYARVLLLLPAHLMPHGPDPPTSGPQRFPGRYWVTVTVPVKPG